MPRINWFDREEKTVPPEVSKKCSACGGNTGWPWPSRHEAFDCIRHIRNELGKKTSVFETGTTGARVDALSKLVHDMKAVVGNLTEQLGAALSQKKK